MLDLDILPAYRKAYRPVFAFCERRVGGISLMKRRRFVSGAAGIVASEILSASGANAQTAALAVSRTSQLTGLSTDGQRAQVQDVVTWGNLVYCLYSTRSTGSSLASRSWGFTVTNTDGRPLWSCGLPAAKYLRIGIQNGNVLLTAVTFVDSSGLDHPNCLLQLDQTGSIAVLQSLGAGFKGSLLFAGDSTFVRLDSASVDVWRLSGSLTQGFPTNAIQPWTVLPNVDLLSKDTLTLTRIDGSRITTVNLSSGAVAEHDITVSAIKSAVAFYQNRAANPAMGHAGVIVATGADGAGSLYGLVVPAAPSAVPIFKLSNTGVGSLWKSLQLASRVPALKLFLLPGEEGVALADGSVSWYQG